VASTEDLRTDDFVVDRTATLGRVGLDLARQHCPDLIRLGPRLPDIPGLHVERPPREVPTTAAIAPFVISADSTSGPVLRLPDVGVQEFLTKSST
jgi:CheY-like chemotaxis protein